MVSLVVLSRKVNKNNIKQILPGHFGIFNLLFVEFGNIKVAGNCLQPLCFNYSLLSSISVDVKIIVPNE